VTIPDTSLEEQSLSTVEEEISYDIGVWNGVVSKIAMRSTP
jgi:hypothetical protein